MTTTVCRASQRMLLAALSAAIAGCATPSVPMPLSGLWGKSDKSQTPDKFAVAKRELKDPAKVHLKWAQLQEKNGRPKVAREYYQQVLKEEPKSAEAILGLARCDQLDGRTDEAEQRFRHALQLHPDDPHVLDAAGQFFASQKRWSEALNLLGQAVKSEPHEKRYRFHLAVAMARAGDVSGAMPHFAKSVGDAQAHYNVGYIFYEQGNLDAAKGQFTQALIKDPRLHQAQRMLTTVRTEQENRLILTSGQATENPFGHASDQPHHQSQPQKPARY